MKDERWIERCCAEDCPLVRAGVGVGTMANLNRWFISSLKERWEWVELIEGRGWNRTGSLRFSKSFVRMPLSFYLGGVERNE